MAEEEIIFPQVRMEEYEELPGLVERRPARRRVGFLQEAGDEEDSSTLDSAISTANDTISTALRELTTERGNIINSKELKPKDKTKLLQENRKAMIVISGGNVRETENVAKGILIFGAVVLIVLALLTTFAGLPSEVTLAFVGTVLGGTIATIAQKIGKL